MTETSTGPRAGQEAPTFELSDDEGVSLSTSSSFSRRDRWCQGSTGEIGNRPITGSSLPSRDAVFGCRSKV